MPPSILLQGFIIISNEVSASGAGGGRTITLGKDQHAHRLAKSVRQHDHVAHLLVGLARVETQCACELQLLNQTW